jgi:hypothetical protein
MLTSSMWIQSRLGDFIFELFISLLERHKRRRNKGEATTAYGRGNDDARMAECCEKVTVRYKSIVSSIHPFIFQRITRTNQRTERCHGGRIDRQVFTLCIRCTAMR